MEQPMSCRIGFLIFPNAQQFDLTGAYEVFSMTKGITVDLVWKNKDFLQTATGIPLRATQSFADCPQLDVICVPGGPGTDAIMEDTEVLGFLRSQALGARYVTSVCSGSLVLGAAGLLTGKRATSHWNCLHFLPRLGATPVSERVVTDGNVITAAGVSAGIDFAFGLLAELMGQEEAEMIQLMLEYAPKPPFHSGSVEEASEKIFAKTKERMAPNRVKKDQLFARMGL
jgi:cyclohexyl-isocyanide hydratase